MILIDLLRDDIKRLNPNVGYPTFFKFLKGSFISVFFIRLTTGDSPLPLLAKSLFKIFLKFFFAIEVNPKCKIGGGLLLPHPRNIILGGSQIGSNCTIMHGVTLGSDKIDFDLDATTRPSISDNCFIGINTVILGGGNLPAGSSTKPNTFVHLKYK